MRLCPCHEANQKKARPSAVVPKKAQRSKLPPQRQSQAADLYSMLQVNNSPKIKKKTLCTDCAKSTRAESILNIHPGSVANPAKHATKSEAYSVITGKISHVN